MRNTMVEADSSTFSTGLPFSPMDDRAKPLSTAMNSTGSTSPLLNAPMKVSGMMCMKKSTTLSLAADAAYWLSPAVLRVAGSMFMPTPGRNRYTAARPIIRLTTVRPRNNSNVLLIKRPKERLSVMPAMPVTMVQNTTGAIIILISLMKASPSGLSATACCAQKWPTTTPSRTAQRI